MPQRTPATRGGDPRGQGRLWLYAVAVIVLGIVVLAVVLANLKPSTRTAAQRPPATVPPTTKPGRVDSCKALPADSNEGNRIERPAPAEPPTGKDLLSAILDTTDQVVQTVDSAGRDVFRLSEQQELQAGNQMHQRILGDLPVSTDTRMLARLNRVAAKLQGRTTQFKGPFTFTLINDQTVNAFAICGGHVYVFTGLMEALKDDSELAYVIGHEIGHVDLRHCADRAAYSIAAERIGGDLSAMLTAAVYQTVSSGYNKKQEFAADEYGVRIAQAAGFDPRGALATLRAFLREEQDERTEGGRPNSPEQRGNEFEKALEQVKHHYGTHPPTTERIANVEAVLGSLPARAP